MSYPPSRISYFATTDHRATYVPFGIKQHDRLSHMYFIGRTGTGKSTALESLIRQDIHAGDGCCLVDPHGDLVERIARSVPPSRKDDLVYLNVPDASQEYGYNPLRTVSLAQRPLAAGGFLEVLKKLSDKKSWGQRMEHILRNALLALLDYPHATISDVLLLLADKEFRREVLEHVENSEVVRFWQDEYAHYSPRLRAEAIVPIQNRVGSFLSDPNVKRILTGGKTQISIRKIMDGGKILLVNLSKGQLGEDSASLLGGLLVTTIGLAAFSRAGVPPEERRPFWVYVDEFQTFTTLALANMLSELRKYEVGMILAHQYLHQLDPDIRSSVLGNAGTLCCFRVSAEDSVFLSRELAPRLGSVDLLKLPNYKIYLKLMIDGAPSEPFSARTQLPLAALRRHLAHRFRKAFE